MSGSGPVLLYDGLCGLCVRTVQIVLRGDRRGVLRFAPLQGDFAAEVFERPQYPYTRTLLAASPVPDPDLQAERRRALRQAATPAAAESAT